MDSENHLRETNTFHNKNNKQMRDRRKQLQSDKTAVPSPGGDIHFKPLFLSLPSIKHTKTQSALGPPLVH